MIKDRELLGDPNELVAESQHRQTSLKLPLAISHLLDIKVEQTNAGLEQADKERTTRGEMVAMLIATACREDVEGLSLDERILYYREMTLGECLAEPVSTSIS